MRRGLLDFSGMTVGQAFLYLLGLTEIFDSFDPETLKKIEFWRKLFDEAFNKLEDVQRKISPKQLRALKKLLDFLRDRAYLYFRFKIEAELYSEDEEKRKAAEVLMELIKSVGFSLQLFGYAKQTRAMSALIKNLESDLYWGYVCLLGLSEEFSLMKSRAQDFIDNDEKENEIKSDLAKINVEEIYEEVYQTYSDLIGIIELFNRTQPDDVLANLYHRIEEHAKKFAAQIKADNTRRENEKKEEEENNDTPNDQDDPNAGDLPNDDTPNEDEDPNNGRE